MGLSRSRWWAVEASGAAECRCRPPREVRGRWEAKCAAVRPGRRGGTSADAGHLELSICRLAPMSSLSAALMSSRLIPGAVSEPASTTVS